MTTEARELLELAAKAAKYPVRGIAAKMVAYLPDDAPHIVIGNERGGDSIWNPRDDDGDAMRLLVKLHLELRVVDYGAIVWSKKFNRWIAYEAHLHGGIEAATRLAIVHAAAEIGKTITTKEAA